jgi:hypothetical protein
VWHALNASSSAQRCAGKLTILRCAVQVPMQLSALTSLTSLELNNNKIKVCCGSEHAKDSKDASAMLQHCCCVTHELAINGC